MNEEQIRVLASKKRELRGTYIDEFITLENIVEHTLSKAFTAGPRSQIAIKDFFLDTQLSTVRKIDMLEALLKRADLYEKKSQLIADIKYLASLRNKFAHHDLVIEHDDNYNFTGITFYNYKLESGETSVALYLPLKDFEGKWQLIRDCSRDLLDISNMITSVVREKIENGEF